MILKVVYSTIKNSTKAISCDEKEFEEYLNSVSRIKSNNKINTPQKTALLKAV